MLKQVTIKISPKDFDTLHVELQRARGEGYNEAEAVRWACSMIGYWPKPLTETILIVDPTVIGGCYAP